MATGGRRPKPTALHRLEGTLNVTKHIRDRAGKEPVAPGNLTDPPDDLTAEQAESWQYALTNAPKGVLRAIDRGVLSVWVIAEDRHRKANLTQAKLDQMSPDMPFMITDKKRGLMISPYVQIMTNAAATMLRAASELGFSPAARPRISADTSDAATQPETPWQKLRVMQGGKA